MVSSELEALDDDALAQRARSNRAALEALLVRSAPVVAGVAYSILGQHEDSLDAAQTALIGVAANLTGVWSGKSYRAWLFTYARSAAIDLRRKNASVERIARRHAKINVSREQDMPEPLAEREEVLAALREELAALPLETAAALSLYHLDGLRVADVAAQLGLSIDACQQRLSRGRESLRERLERRGLAPEGAALAVAAGIENMFSSAKSWAAEVAPGAYSKLARTALSSGNDRAPSRSFPITPLATTAYHDWLASANDSLAAREPMQRTRHMFKTYLLVFGGLILLGGAGLRFVTFQSPPTGQQLAKQIMTVADVSPQMPISATGGARSAETKAGAAADTKAGAESRATPQWQPPRFISGMFDPIAIAASHGRVALLAGDATKSLEPRKITLMESLDAGQSWKSGPSVEGYMNGSVAIEEDGSCSCLFVVGKPFNIFTNPSPSGVRIEWRSSGSNAFDNPMTIWSAQPGASFSLATSLIHVAGGTWAFAINKSGGRSLEVAYGNSNSCPKPLTCGWKGHASAQPASWALDTKTAGFVLIDPANAQQLVHCVTRDGGASWISSAVPFGAVGESDATRLSIEPEMLARDGNSILLVAQTLTISTNSTNSINPTLMTAARRMVYQRYALTSPDLGKTWSAPVFLGLSSETMEDIQRDGILRLSLPAIYNGRLFIGKWKLPSASIFADDRFQRPSAAVIVSDDAGKNWYNHHAFDGLGKNASDVILSSDGESLHAALFKQLGNDTGCLIIRSFNAREWQASNELPPAWFREDKLAIPTKEEF